MGNITAGIDLISRLRKFYGKKHEAYGLTVPLLTTSSGEKFGKSAGNAVFIDSSLTTLIKCINISLMFQMI